MSAWRVPLRDPSAPSRGRVRLPIGVIIGLAALTLGAGECSYRGHLFGSVGGTPAAEHAQGPVSAFGSVTVGGIEYATGGAAVTQDGAAGLESELVVGELATLTGSLDAAATTGTATALSVDSKLVGPISGIDAAAGTVTVLGQTVRFNGDTSVGADIVPGDPGGLRPGDSIAVDGLRTSSGWLATRVDRATPGRALRVLGRVAGLKAFGQSFTLGATTIDFSAAGTVPPALANGQFVAATGATLSTATTLQATLIEAKLEAPSGAGGDNGSLYGAITRFVSSSDFDVAGQAVSTTATTQWVHGGPAGLSADAVLELSGQYDDSTRLIASRIDVRPERRLRVVGPVDALDPAAPSVTIAGIVLATGARTRWDDRGTLPLRNFAFANLRSGDWLEVRGVASGPRTASADLIERQLAPSPARVELQDLAAAVAEPAFTLSGVSIDAHSAYFQDASGQSLSRAAFFAVAAGRLVRARGVLITGTLVAELVVLRD